MVNASIKPRFFLLCGLSATLVACGGEGSGSAPVNRPTRFLSIQPIQVCDDLGVLCAELALFEDATRKIWEQANIAISFLNPNRLNASRFLTIDDQEEFAELSFAGGVGAFGRHPLSTRTTGPLNMWFVDQIFDYDEFAETLGLGWIDQNGIVISDNLLGFNNGSDRLDTVAHEIGHNLGLTHSNFGAGDRNNLMTDGSGRNSPLTLADITPDGARFDQLTESQINFARQSPLMGDIPNNFPATGPVDPPTSVPAFLDAAPDQVAIAPLAISLATTQGLPPQVELPPAPFSEVGYPVKGQVAPALTPPTITIPESAPLVELAAQIDPSLAVSNRIAPQPVPNGPAMSVGSAVLLGLYLGRRRNR